MKKIIIGVLVIIEIFSLYMMYQINNSKSLNEVSIKNNKINKDVFAVYWDENGDGTYTEYTQTTWPSSGYTLNLIKTECMNEKGDKLENPEITFNHGTITLSNTETTYCILYFEKLKASILLYDNQIKNRTSCTDIQCAIDELYKASY